MKKFLKFAGVFGLLFSVACEKNTSSDEFRYSGTVETTKVTLSSKVASDIVKFSLEEGDEVKAGEPVVRVDLDVLKNAGYSPQTMIVITEPSEEGKLIEFLEFGKEVTRGEILSK